jgi:hypothetical protein
MAAILDDPRHLRDGLQDHDEATMNEWKHMPDAPHDRAVLLYLPGVWVKMDVDGGAIRKGHPLEVGHGRVVGWWDETITAWVTGFHPNEHLHKVYPSLWAELPAGPDL